MYLLIEALMTNRAKTLYHLTSAILADWGETDRERRSYASVIEIFDGIWSRGAIRGTGSKFISQVEKR
jgi:hypothetical protein